VYLCERIDPGKHPTRPDLDRNALILGEAGHGEGTRPETRAARPSSVQYSLCHSKAAATRAGL
jgi:hypothetical protein